MGVIIYNGKSSEELGIRIARFPDYTMPERVYENVHVPGKNGDVVMDTGTFNNVNREYDISVPALNNDYYRTIDQISKWLHSSSGYARLEDTYDQEHYRMAIYKESSTIENLFNEAGQATIAFECKPQRYYKVGDVPVLCTSSRVIFNHTGFVSLPIMVVKINRNVTGTITINGKQITIKEQDISDTLDITIDSEVQDAYSGTLNMNSMISTTDGEFPKLDPGNNNVSFSGGIVNVKIMPRWWTI